MKIPKWLGIGFLIFFFIPYLATFVPMLIEGAGEMFGFSILGQPLMDKIHMYVVFVWGAEAAAFVVGYLTFHIIAGFMKEAPEDYD